MPFSWTLPDPPNGVVSVPSADTNAQAALFYGEDIYFNVADGTRADYIVTPAGDWQTVTEMEALKQSLLRRTITNPNEWRTKPGYGVGAKQFLKAKDTPSSRAELELRIRAQYAIDQRIERVDAVTIERVDDAAGPYLLINVRFTPRGQLRTDASATIVITVR